MTRIEKLRKIVSECQHDKIDGILVDLFTATAILACYDLASEGAKHTIETAPLDKVANVALKMRVRRPEVV